MVPEPSLLARFADDLNTLITVDARVGIAVSGGPDSLALLLLASASRPQRIEAATVDHGLREEGRAEAEAVGAVCRGLDVPHRILTIEWAVKPETAIQERGRQERYLLLGSWAKERGLDAIATAHHLDDQAETLLMRLARGSGVRGLAGMRAVSRVPGSDLPLLRPLLGWRRQALRDICAAAGLEPSLDPSNEDERFERIRVRRGLSEANWLDPAPLASSATYLGEADAALDWAARQEWARAVTNGGGEIVYRPAEAPTEIRRRIVVEVLSRLAAEGQDNLLRGRELERLLATLGDGGAATLRGVLCRGGVEWRFAKAPERRS